MAPKVMVILLAVFLAGFLSPAGCKRTHSSCSDMGWKKCLGAMMCECLQAKVMSQRDRPAVTSGCRRAKRSPREAGLKWAYARKSFVAVPLTWRAAIAAYCCPTALATTASKSAGTSAPVRKPSSNPCLLRRRQGLRTTFSECRGINRTCKFEELLYSTKDSFFFCLWIPY